MRQGKSDVDLGGSVAKPALRHTVAPSDSTTIRSVARYSPGVAEVSVVDRPLREALATVTRQPTLAGHLAVAQAYRRLGIFDLAFDHLRRGAAFDEQNAAINDAMARTWRDWGFPGLGLSNAHRAVFASPRSADVRHTLGTLLFALGQRAEAERAFKEAVALNPLAWYSLQNLCALALADGRTQQATIHCQRAAAARTASLKANQP